MRGLNEIDALQRAWSDPGGRLSWVCDFIHDGRIPRPERETHTESLLTGAATQSTQDSHEIERPVDAGRSPLAWMLIGLSALIARPLGRWTRKATGRLRV
jgi:hypothetical protein